MTTDILTNRSRLLTPEALDLVPAEIVDERIAQVELELADLEREAAELCAAADAAESEASTAALDAGATAWTIVRLQRFLDELRAEAERDAATMIEVARHQARIQAAELRTGIGHERARNAAAALRLVPPAAPVDTSTPASPPVPPVVRPVPTRPLADPVVVPVGSPVLPDTVDVAEVVAPVEPAPVVAEVVAPVEPAPVVAEVVAPVEPAPVVAEVVAPVEPAPVVAEVVAPVEPAPVVAEAVGGTPTPRAKRSLPVAAILEIAAVLLLLAFILYRLS